MTSRLRHCCNQIPKKNNSMRKNSSGVLVQRWQFVTVQGGGHSGAKKFTLWRPERRGKGTQEEDRIR